MKSAGWLALLAICVPSAALADEPSGLQAAIALEQVLVEAIARAEKSVVAIARVRADVNRLDFTDENADDRPFVIPRFVLPKPDPTNPEFVPNEFGTGVVVDRAGLIVTNYHVLGDIAKSSYWVWVDRKPYKATVKAADPWFDLAVLKIDASDLTPIPFGDAKQVKRGQIVISLGNPQAIARDGLPSASWGIVSNLSRKAPASPDAPRTTAAESIHHYGTLIQTDAKLNLGTSGGALLNLKGEMIGLTTSLAALEGNDTAAGFAIPIDDAFQRTLESLKAGRKAEYGFLGIGPESLSPEDVRRGQVGVRVRQMVAGTPADRAGLQEGDIIAQIGGVAVHDSFELMRELSRLPADYEVSLVVQRPNRVTRRSDTLTKTVRLSKKHLANSRPEFASEPDPTWRGLRIDYATAVPRFGELTSLLDRDGCVAILDVTRDSPAWHAGLRPGMFLSHVNNKQVATPKEFFAEVTDKPGALRLRLTSGDVLVRTVAP